MKRGNTKWAITTTRKCYHLCTQALRSSTSTEVACRTAKLKCRIQIKIQDIFPNWVGCLEPRGIRSTCGVFRTNPAGKAFSRYRISVSVEGRSFLSFPFLSQKLLAVIITHPKLTLGSGFKILSLDFWAITPPSLVLRAEINSSAPLSCLGCF